MRSVVIIPTLGRGGLVNKLLRHLERQHRLPDEVIVSGVETEDEAESVGPLRFPVTCIKGSRGSCAQRNRALEYALPRSDVITFFDDDFLPADDYLARLLRVFEDRADCAVVMGHPAHDGVRGAGFTFEEGLALLRAAKAAPERPVALTDHPGAYGCNMSFRSRDAVDLRFDERLVLHGWQEDIDFTSRLRDRGRIVGLSTLTGVHLGFKAGRVSGVRFGYSQVANPVYMLRKGTMPLRFACDLVGRNLAANCLKSLWPEAHIDRRGRLKGNILALAHLLTGRVEPEQILKL